MNAGTNNDSNYVDTPKALGDMCREIQHREWLAVDTEFIRVKTYFPQLALIQIASHDRIYCVDVKALTDLSSLFDILEKPTITKVFHSAGQDLEMFFHQRGCILAPIFDTQIAAALLGHGEQLSYQALVLALLGVEIDKSQARTEWMRRPLKTEQLRYAADDVRYLAQLYPIEVAELVRQRRMDWLKDEVERLYFPSCYQLDLSLCWEHVKGAGKLKRNELNVLKHLAAWREKLAIQRDLPRKWLVSDETLLSLAIEQPQNERQSISPQLQEHRTVRGHMKELVALITQAQQEPEALWPHGNHCRRPSEAEDEAVDSLMSIIRTRADELRISPSRITSKSDLLKLVRGERTLLLLSGWRLKIAGQAVLDALDTHRERSY